jgi:hypothetical protein
MSTRKMLVVLLTKTNAVLGVATRRTAGVPPVAELVGGALLARTTQESGVPVPADELTVKEVDYSDDVVRQPLAHIIDASGTVVAAVPKITAIANTTLAITLTVSAAPPADKTVVVVVDGGSSHDPLTFVGKTPVSATTTISVPASGVPPGDHVVIASLDGYATFVAERPFT